MRKTLGAQGEVMIFEIDALPEGLSPATVELNHKGQPILSHSERGHHHVLERPVQLLERKSGDLPGMKTLYAILDEPNRLIQDAPNPHGAHTLTARIVEFRIGREYNPFADEIRRIAD